MRGGDTQIVEATVVQEVQVIDSEREAFNAELEKVAAEQEREREEKEKSKQQQQIEEKTSPANDQQMNIRGLRGENATGHDIDVDKKVDVVDINYEPPGLKIESAFKYGMNIKAPEPEPPALFTEEAGPEATRQGVRQG